MHKERRDIAVSKIEPNKFNPNVMSKETYEALVQDMKMTGPKHDVAIGHILVSPKNVFYNDPDFTAETFVIIDGEHRWQAAVDLGWETIPSEIRCIGEELGKIMNYRRNRERGTIDPLKEAALFKSEVDQGLTQERIGLKYNVSQAYIAHRLKLVALDQKVVDLYREPESTYKEMVQQHYEEKKAVWEEKVKEAEEEGKGRVPYQYEPDELKEEDLMPRGIMTGSHLEAISTLPEQSQVALAAAIVEQDLNVRETEALVKRQKRELAKQKRFEDALAKAKRPNCPSCGKPAEDFYFDNEQMFKCYRGPCYEKWDYMKTAAETKREREAERSESEEKRSEEVREKFKEARENPRYIRLPETPDELDKKVRPWLLRKLRQLTEVGKISIQGKRGDDDIRIDYTPPGGDMYYSSRMSLTMDVTTGDKSGRYAFDVEAKQYKKLKDKCRVNMGYGMKPTDENREALRAFFSEVVLGTRDPKLVGDIDESRVENLKVVPCETCANDGVSCNRERFHVDESGVRYICESHEEKAS